jgi:hypothetical protein
MVGVVGARTYPVADDGLVDEFSSAGDTARGGRRTAVVTADFACGPAPCRCHVEPGGPDTVIIGSSHCWPSCRLPSGHPPEPLTDHPPAARLRVQASGYRRGLTATGQTARRRDG